MQPDTLHTRSSHKRWGWHCKDKVYKVPIPLLHLGTARVFAGRTCRHRRNPGQRQTGRWMAEATSSTPRGCSTLCADVMQSKQLHAVVCFLLASADSLSRTAVTPQQILQNTSLLPHCPLNRYDFTQPRWTTAYC